MLARRFDILRLYLCCGLGLCGPMMMAQEAATKDMLVHYFEGSYTAVDSDASIWKAMHAVEIWKQSEDRWVYTERHGKERLQTPTKQVIYKVEEAGTNRFILSQYLLPKPGAFIGDWKKPRRFNELNPEDLIAAEDCEIALVYKEEQFVGNIQAKCQMKWNGSTYQSSSMTLFEQMLIGSDIGYDESGELVWKSNTTFTKD